jgi:peptide deformylase
MASQDDIIFLPNDSLRKKSQRVRIVDDEITSLVDDMAEALLDWEAHRKHEVGVALAAVQIDSLKRVVIVRNNFDDKNDRTFVTFINPQVVRAEGPIVEDFEGCLSIKNIYGKVPRHNKIKVKALDLEGNEFRVILEGFPARILQHEIDHTNGVVFIDHIKDNPKAFYALKDNGELEELNYDEEIKDSILW